ncbi:heavy-metal-associated domain-containing protein [Sedimentitalea sp. HM32M-2]|uniref:heavy-metal-associated domain-containing protein n=1 Tax=Sedimentitalea sp. HM32M-2 TaxID=3351566 RepID=UPI0036287345
MKLKTPMSALIVLLIAAALVAAEQTVPFSVPGMYCDSCPFVVEAAISGVRSVTANSETRTAMIVFDDEVATLRTIRVASAAAGYEATPVASGS